MPVGSLPPVAVDDAFIFESNAGPGGSDGNVFLNEDNPDGVPFGLVEVGDAGAPGRLVQGSNGGLFRIMPDGTLDFDANGDFDDLDYYDMRETEVTYTIGFEGIAQTFDVMLLQDLSASFANDLENLKKQIPGLLDELNTDFDAAFGVASFVDKPVVPFGSVGDYVYRTDLAVTDDSAEVRAVLEGLSVLSGYDSPESQLEALLQLAARSETKEVGFREGSQRLVVLTTDASFHQEGDFDRLDGKPVPDNDGDAVIETEDYPSVEAVRQALQDADITPVFAVTSGAMSYYEGLVAQLGFGVVVELTSNSSNLVDAILDGLENAGGESTATVTASVYGTDADGSAPVIYENKVTGGRLEGSTRTISISAYDPDADEPAKLDYSFDLDGDGTYDVTNLTGVVQSTWLDDGVKTVTVNVVDEDGRSRTEFLDVTVDNAKAKVTLEEVDPIVAGGVVRLKGTIDDPGVLDTFTLTIDWGDIGAPGRFETVTFPASSDGTQNFSLTHRYPAGTQARPVPEAYTIKAVVADDDSGRNVAFESVEVLNRRPSVDLDPVARVDENGLAVLTGKVRDPDAGDTLTLKVDWGDETRKETVTLADDGDGARSFRLTHIYRDDRAGDLVDRYKIEATVTDAAGASDSETVMARVRNVAPSFDGGTQADIPGGGPVSFSRKLAFSGRFADEGRRDDHDITIDWGDGSTLSSAEHPSRFDKLNARDGVSNFSATHNYQTGGAFRIRSTVEDDDGGRDTMRDTVYISGMRLTDGGELQIIGDNGPSDVHVYSDRGSISDGGRIPATPGDGNNILTVTSTILGGMEQSFTKADAEKLYFRGSEAGDVVILSDGIGLEGMVRGQGGADDLRGSDARDEIYGGNGADLLFGQDGRDTVVGGFGNDQVFGDFDAPGRGSSDFLEGRFGNDTVHGGGGMDTVEGDIGRDWLAGGFGSDIVLGGASGDVIFGDEDRFEPAPGGSTSNGDLSAQRVLPQGRLPAAVTGARDGDDTLSGEEGNDRIFGQGGNDEISGGSGNDTVSGGKGRDVISLGAGDDVVVMMDGDGRDVVLDYAARGRRDRIDLRDLDHTGIADAGDALDRARQDGDDVFVNLGGGDSLRLVGVALTDLSQGDFWV